MTHTLHRQGTEATLRKDYVFLSMAAKGLNENGADEKMREFLRIVSRHHPVNIGDMRTGNLYNTSMENILNQVTSTSIVHAVFIDRETVTEVLTELKEADLGMSVVVSGPFDAARRCCREAGLRPHTVDYSAGIWGKTEKLPPVEILEVTTMCGHAMIAPKLVTSLVEDIKAGKIDSEEAGKTLAKRCECGIFNPSRAADLLKTMANG
jgi:hypothetical protein